MLLVTRCLVPYEYLPSLRHHSTHECAVTPSRWWVLIWWKEMSNKEAANILQRMLNDAELLDLEPNEIEALEIAINELRWSNREGFNP